MTIRQATEADAEALVAIYAPYITDTAITFENDIPSTEEFRGRIRAIAKEYPYPVIEEDGAILGYAYASCFHAREAYRHSVETSIYLRQDMRGRGLGCVLYEALEKALYRQNVYTLYACITRADDEHDPYVTNASIRFHERNGYKLIGSHDLSGYKFDRWYSIVWMEKVMRERAGHPDPFIPYEKL